MCIPCVSIPFSTEIAVYMPLLSFIPTSLSLSHAGLHLPSLLCRALWSKDECRSMCWQLDPTEGPGRVRRRMMRAPLTIHNRHIMSDTPPQQQQQKQKQPAGGGGGGEGSESADKSECTPNIFLLQKTCTPIHVSRNIM